MEGTIQKFSLQVRRSLEYLLTPAKAERLVLSATYNDDLAPEEADIALIIQALLGSNREISFEEAQTAFLQRPRQDWTWKVLAKILILCHTLIETPRAQPEWLTKFFTEINLLNILHLFVDSSNSIAEAHAKVIRQYAVYLKCLLAYYANSPYRPGFYLSKESFCGRDLDELSLLLAGFNIMMEKCLEPFDPFIQAQFMHGFNKLTYTLLIHLVKNALHFHKCAGVVIDAISEFAFLHEADKQYATKLHMAYEDIAKKVDALCTFTVSQNIALNIATPDFLKNPLANRHLKFASKPQENLNSGKKAAVLSLSTSASENHILKPCSSISEDRLVDHQDLRSHTTPLPDYPHPTNINAQTRFGFTKHQKSCNVAIALNQTQQDCSDSNDLIDLLEK